MKRIRPYLDGIAKIVNVIGAIGLIYLAASGIKNRLQPPVELVGKERRIIGRDVAVYKPGETVQYSNLVRNNVDCEVEITRFLITMDGSRRYRLAQETRVIRGDGLEVENINEVVLPRTVADGRYGLASNARYHCDFLDEFVGRYLQSSPIVIDIKF